MVKNGHDFEWRPIHQRCFDMIKYLACKAPILKPIDLRLDDPIWVICDASLTGVGAMYGQGPEWQKCQPAGFMSKKFTVAQHSYRVFELELIAIFEALHKWEDKLLGRKINIITDHKALEFFESQVHLSHRQTRWMEFLSQFNYTITYVKGQTNKVADCLSRYYESDQEDEMHPYDEYVTANARLDPEGEDLPFSRLREVKSVQVGPTKKDQPLSERRTIPRVELNAMRKAEKRSLDAEEDPLLFVPGDSLKPLNKRFDPDESFFEAAKRGYPEDPTFGKVLHDPKHFATFNIRDGLIYFSNRMGDAVLCVPRGHYGKKSIVGVIIDHAHTTLGHFGQRKTNDYIHRWYWWPTLSRDVEKFCQSCGTCQTVKPSTQLPTGLLHSLPIPTKPWGSVASDFLGPFPKSEGFDYLWVVLCRLTSNCHLIPLRTTTKASELAWIFLKEIIQLHGLPDSMVSDRDAKFTSKFWKELHRLMGTKLLMSTSFHPQTDGATERANRIISQILRSLVSPKQKDWVSKLPMVEFALNSSINQSTGYAPFELVYGDMPRMVTSIPEDNKIPGV